MLKAEIEKDGGNEIVHEVDWLEAWRRVRKLLGVLIRMTAAESRG